MTISLEVRDLDFSYNKTKILNNISFNIKPGTFMSIIGPNGSGKSTLLKNISSILNPERGEIILGGKSISKMSSKEIAQNIAVVPQSTNIEFNFSALDIVLMGRNPYKKRFQSEDLEDYRIVKETMELTDTWNLRNRIINELSGGERQRVIIARALAQEPKIILLDEPTSYLDIQHQIDILDLLKRLNREEGLTVITVLHDINLAARYSDYMLLLKNGKIIRDGTAEEVITLDNLKKTYEIDMVITKNPYTNTPYMVPLTKVKETKKKGARVHIVCGGGTGGDIIQRLFVEGFIASAGVLNIGDSDWELCTLWGIEMVTEDPFTNISEEAHNKNIAMIEKSDVVILSNMPIGSGNIKNLKAVLHAIRIGKKVLFLDNYCDKYDFTKGEGIDILNSIREEKIITCRSLEELVRNI